MSTRFVAALWLGAAILVSDGLAQTWDGGGADDNWTTANNWNPNAAPANNGTANIIFGGTVRLNPQVTTNQDVASITFNNTAGGFTISGSSTLTVRAGGITNSDASLQQLNTPITLATNQTVSSAIGQITFGGASSTLALGANTITMHTPVSPIIIFNGGMSGSGTLIKTGGSFIRFHVPTTFTGTYRIEAGDLVLSGDSRLADTSDVVVAGGSFNLNAFNETIDQLTMTSGEIDGSNGDSLLTCSAATLESGFVSARLAGATNVVKNTPGTVELAANNTYTGTTTINDGVLLLTRAQALPSTTFVILNAPGVLQLGDAGSGTTPCDVRSLTGTGNVSIQGTSGSDLEVGEGNVSDMSYGGSISGGGSLTKAGPAALTLSAAQSYSGSTYVSGGTLRLGASNVLPDTTNLTISSNDTLDLQSFNDTVDSLTLADGTIVGIGTLSAGDFDLRSGTVSAKLGGAATLNKTTAGLVTLSAANSYTGGTTITGGVLEVATNSSLGHTSGAVSVGNATLRVLGTTTSSRNFVLTNATLEPLGTLTLSGLFLFGSGQLTKAGAGVLRIQSLYDGDALLVSAGDVEVSTGGIVLLSGAGTINAGAFLHVVADSSWDSASTTNNGEIQLDANGQIYGALTNNGDITGDGRFGGGPLTNSATGRIESFTGGDLQFVSTAAHSNAGEIAALGGRLEFDGPLTNVASTGLIIANDANLFFDAGLMNAGSLSFSGGDSFVFGDVNNPGTIVVTGLGTATFTDDVTNTGQVQTSAGNAASFLGAVSGAGSFPGGGTVFLEGDLRPGASPAIVTFGGDLVLGALSTTEIEIGGTAPGSGHDRLAIVDTANLAGTLSVTLINGFVPAPGDAFQIVTAGALSGTFGGVVLTNFPSSPPMSLEYSTTGVTLRAHEPAVVDLGVIYTKIPGHPTASVPGVRDLNGLPTQSDFRAMVDLRVSPDGSYWVLRALSQLGSDLENILLLGSGTTGNAFAQEGQPIPGGAPGELFDFFSSGLGAFNTLNDFAYAARARGGVASVFQKVIVWDGATQAIAFQMGDPYFNLQDLPPNPSGDETVGNSVGSIHILDDSTIGSQDSTVLGISTTRRPVLTYDRDMFQQSNVTTINALGGIGVATWNTIDSNEFFTTPDGAHWLAEGRVNAAPTNPRVLVRDGSAVLQEAQPVSTSGLLLGDILQSNLLANGDWLAHGRDISGNTAAAPDWAVRNGILIAKTGAPLHLGSADTWGDTLYAVAANRVGDYVVAGNTTAPTATNDVIVLNGVEVVLREGDPVDVDGDGLFDDNAFIGRGDNTLSFMTNGLNGLMYLTDDRVLFAVINLRDGSGNDWNSNPAFLTPSAFVRVTLAATPSCPGERGDANCDGSINFFDIDPFLLALFNPASYAATFCDGSICAADADCSDAIDFFDIDPFLQCLFSGCAPCP